MNVVSDMYLSSLSAVGTVGGFFSLGVGERWVLTQRTRSKQNKFYLIVKGSCTITIEGVEYLGKPGDLFLIPAGTSHTYENHRDEPFCKFWVQFDLLPDNAVISLLDLPYVVQAPKEGRAYRLFRRYAKLADSEELTERIFAKALLLELFAEYIALAFPDGVTVGVERSTPLGEILQYINNHLADPLSVPELAARCYLHPNHFTRLFKSKTGQTPARYIRYKKMELAKVYLERSELSIQEIMARVGEEDPFAFSKRFKSYSSYSPREYRRIFGKNSKVDG